jgi:hypothetical protein
MTITADVLGWLGCSNTMQAEEAYEGLGGSKFWPSDEVDDYGGGELHVLATALDSAKWWATFTAAVKAHGADAVFLQACVHVEFAGTAASDLSVVLNRIHDHAGQLVPVYLSPINPYPVGFQTNVAWGEAATVVASAVRDGVALAGPVMPALTAKDIKSDKVHLKHSGATKVGQALLSFFG